MLHVTWGIPALSGGGGIYCRNIMTENLCDFEPVTFPKRKQVNEVVK